MTNRKKIIKALINCTSLHTSTTCLNCPYAVKPGEVVHYGDVSCTVALLRDCLRVMSQDTQKFKSFIANIKNIDGNDFVCSDYHHGDEIYWFNHEGYEQKIDDIVKELEDND